MEWGNIFAFVLGLLAGFPIYLAFDRMTSCRAVRTLLKNFDKIERNIVVYCDEKER